MKTIIRDGVLLGFLVTLWMFIFGLTGMHKNAGLAMVFILVATVIEIGVLVPALRKTAAQGRGWLGQVSAGTLLAFIGGCLIFAMSLLFVNSIQPNYMAESNAAMEAMMRSQGMDEAAIQAALAQSTPVGQAFSGFVGTVITGLVASAILGFFIRSKGPAASA